MRRASALLSSESPGRARRGRRWIDVSPAPSPDPVAAGRRPSLARRRGSRLLGRDLEALLVGAVQLAPAPWQPLAVADLPLDLATVERGGQSRQADVPAGGVAGGLESVVEAVGQGQQAAIRARPQRPSQVARATSIAGRAP